MTNNSGSERFLDSLTNPPSADSAYADWVNGEDDLRFLFSTVSGSVPVYISGPRCFLYSAFVPNERLTRESARDVEDWNFGASAGWGYGCRYEGEGSGRVAIPTVYPPLDGTRTETLEQAEPLVFLRSFEGLGPRSTYIELNQRFAHISDIHWIPERAAHCGLDDQGNLNPLVRIEQYKDWTLCTIDSSLLGFHMFVTDQSLVRVFEFERDRQWPQPVNGNRQSLAFDRKGVRVFAHRVLLGELDSPSAGYLRGAQIVPLLDDKKRLLDRLCGPVSREDREYATYIVFDFKNEQVREWSCDPTQLGNYFVESDLPFETSPVFFRPDVLLKYKQDPDRFIITDSTISCRGVWHLDHYGVNDAGQVFTYLRYLGNLPYSEQLYWKSSNEPPKAGLPETTIARDFRGEWVADNDPLEELKRSLRSFPKAQHSGQSVNVWSLEGRDLEEQLRRIHYVVTGSSKEWADEILQLAKVTVEGLQKNTIRRLAKNLGCDDPKLGSIKLLRQCLIFRKIDEEVVAEVCDPLTALWDTRSKASAHLGGTGSRQDLRQDYKARVVAVGTAMDRLSELILAGVLNLP